MGTSLSGLTPATTFDGLLKTSDNDAITSSLKTIGSGDGTDSCLQLSDSALKVNSGSVTIVGTGATSATTSLLVQNSAGDDMFKTTDDGGTTLKSFGASNTLIIDTSGGVSGFQMNSSNGQQRFRIQGTSTATRFTANNTNDAFTFVGNGIYTSGAFDIPSARLHVKGSGNTGATSSLLIQNSSASDLLRVNDSGEVRMQTLDFLGNKITSLARISTSGLAINNAGTNPDANTQLHIKGAGNTDATTSLLVQNSDGDTLLKVVDDGEVRIGETTGSLTAEGNNVFLRGTNIYFRERLGGYLGNFREEGFQIGNGSAAATAQLQVKGSGATSATTSLLVQNSAGTEHLKITDDGIINARQTFRVNHVTNSSRYVNISWGAIAANDTGSELSLYGGGFESAIFLNGSTKSTAAGATGIQSTGVLIAPSVTQSSFAPSAQLHVQGSGNSSADYALRIENSSASTLIDARNDGVIRLAPNSNQTALFNNAKIKNGDASFGTSTIPASTRMTIKGQGTTSATTALLVENSSGTDTLEVRDDGQINFNGNIYANADYKSIGRNSLNSIRFAGGETRVSVQGTSSANKFHVYASSTATSVFSVFTQTQQVGIGNGSNSLDGTAKLQIDSTTQGFLPPRMTGEQIDAIESPASGLIIYNTTTNKAVCYNGTSWNDMF